MATRLGMDAVLQYDAAGVANDSFTALTAARDVTFSMTVAEADVTDRGNGGWRAVVATLKEAEVSGELIWDDTNAGFTALRDAFLNNTAIGLWPVDHPGTGGQGLKADYMVTEFSREESLEDHIKVSFTAKVTRSATAPVWASIPA